MKPLKIGRPGGKKRKVVFLVLCLISVFFVFNFFNSTANSVYLFFSPTQKTLSDLGSEASFLTKYFFQKEEIKKEIERLKRERNELISEILSLKERERENVFLREALDLELEKEFNLIIADVSSFDVTGGSLLINKGSNDGISENMTVITSKKVLVGQVVEVYDNFSRVIMITHSQSPFFDVLIQPNMVQGVVRGKNGFKAEVDLINKEEEIEKGKGIVTKGEVFPKNLFVGLVNEVVKTDAEPFQKASIQLLFDPRKIEKVFIIKE